MTSNFLGITMNTELNEYEYTDYELSPRYLADMARFEAQMDLLPRIRRVAKTMSFNFDYVATMFEGKNPFEFADFAAAVCAKRTIYHGEGTTSRLEYQSFEVLDIVLLRSSPNSDYSYWLDLTALPCSKKNAKLINDLFEDCWANNYEVPVDELAQLVDFRKLKSDDSLAWRKVMRSFYHNNGNPAAQLLDRAVNTPQRIYQLQQELADLLFLMDIIRPAQHKTESDYERSPRAFKKTANSKPATSVLRASISS
jgi:hypothetical protein